jgi:predicted transporter
MVEILQLSVIGLTLVGIVIGILLLRKWKSGNRGEVNYRAFFIIGITFLPAGVALSASTSNPGFFGMSGLGAAYLAIALANRDKWKQ